MQALNSVLLVVLLVAIAAALIYTVFWLGKLAGKRQGGGNQQVPPANNPNPPNAGGQGQGQGGANPPNQPVAAANNAQQGGTTWAGATSTVLVKLLALIVPLLVTVMVYLIVKPVGKKMDKWADLPVTPSPSERVETFDERLSRMDEVVVHQMVDIIKDRLWRAYQVPVEETEELLSQTGGLPDTKFKDLVLVKYGVPIPENLAHLPMSVDDIPTWRLNERGERERFTIELKFKLKSGTRSRTFNRYGWEPSIYPTDRGSSAHLMYFINDDGTDSTVLFEDGKYRLKERLAWKEIQKSELPTSNIISLSLPMSEGGSEREFVVRLKRVIP